MRVTRLSRVVRATVFRKNPITIYTDSVTPDVFDPSWAFNDASLMTVDWGDGTPIEFHATGLSHVYAAAGTKTVKFTCPDWGKLWLFDVRTDICRLAFPDLAACSGFTWLVIFGNQFSGIFPSCATLTLLQFVYANNNQFSGYVSGSFAIQKNLEILSISVNNLLEASIDAILTDLVTSLAIPGRVVCLVDLSGIGMAPPSNPAGLALKATLVAAWGAGNVLTN